LAWTIELTAKADKQIGKMNRRDAARIVKLLDDVAALEDPRTRGHALTGDLGGLWRYRTGDWRAVCRIEDERVLVLVITIGHRREVYD